MMNYSGEMDLDVEEFRKRIQKMTDKGLIRYGAASVYMCSPQANRGKPPRETFVVQLRECRAEWRRRYPRAIPQAV